MNNLKSIVLWGATGQAKVLNEFLPALGFRVIATFDNDPATTAPIHGVPLHHGELGFEAWQRTIDDEEIYFAVAIGGSHGSDRLRVTQFLLAHGLLVSTLVHPSAYVAQNAKVGAGSQILAGAVVGAETTLSSSCLINTNASVDHECELGEGVHVAPGATLAGCTKVGARAFIGTGASVMPRITIGHDAIVGAGAVVTRDVPAMSVSFGNPARPHRLLP